MVRQTNVCDGHACRTPVLVVVTDNLTNNLFEVMGIRCLVVKFLIQITSIGYVYSSQYYLVTVVYMERFYQRIILYN